MFGSCKGKQKRRRPALEALEERVVPSALPEGPFAFPNVRVLSTALAPLGSPVKTAAGPTPSGGYSPAQVAQAYGFNQISFGSVKGDGSGQTIALIDAYDDPNITGDLATFDSTLGIPAPPSFKKVNQTGGSSYPNADPNWALEISLDVEWAHGMAPGANLLLIEANSSSLSDLLAAVDYARNQPGVSVLSMSWGGKDFSGEASYDSHFTTPSGHAGVTFVASSGDGGSSGAPAYPSVSPQILAVGGTDLYVDSVGNMSSESGWPGSGGGISAYESQPGYQNGVVTQSSSGRTTPDVAANAGMPMGIYDSFGYSGWTGVGGTSASAPQWAALIAIADQGRALAGQSSLDGFSQTLPKLYQLPQSDFHDITSGSNGAYSAGSGYDLVTGRGSPYANLIVSALVGAPVNSTGNPPPTGTGNPPPTGSGPSAAAPASASPNPITGTTTNLSVLGSDPAGESTLTYTWSVLSEPAGALGPSYSANGTNAAKNTTATFHEAGNYTFQVTIRDASGLTATSSVSVMVNQTFTSVGVSPATSTLLDGNSQQFTATTLDQFGKAMSTQPSSFTWTLGAGSVGTLSSAGLYRAPATGMGSATVIATYRLSGSGRVTVTSRLAAPNAPTSLVATAVSKTQINLSWLESSRNVTGYYVQRSSDGGRTWFHIAQITTAYFSDTTVSSGRTYQYRVLAFNSAGYSAWTTSGYVVTPNVLVRGSKPIGMFGSNWGQNTSTSSGQNATASGASSSPVTSATVLDYFLAPPSSGNGDLVRKEIASRFERLAQLSETATTGDDARLMPSALSSI